VKTVKLPKRELDFFASVLQRFGEIHAPVARNGHFVFQQIAKWSDARLDYTRTVLPPKKYFLPPRETMFRYTTGKGYQPESEGLDKRLVLFGVHACDVYSVNILDRVFNGRYPDPYYQTRRRNIAIVGVDCVPDDLCFCRSMRADTVEQGFDLFLYDIGEYYLTLVGTALGDDMVLAGGDLFQPVTAEDVAEYKQRSKERHGWFQLDVEIRDLPEIFEMEYGSEIWDELGARCLSCGSCSMVCPTCYCYDVADESTLGSTEGRRVRVWDSCLFATHAVVAGGENFRGSRSSRVKFRFYHKQRGFVAEYGRPSCVGCGRCAAVCPAGIDMAEVINRLRGVEYGETEHAADQ
jgi:sulfhydrogenase subunit beta (sulfur reductase)